MCSGLIWHRIGASCEVVRTRWRTFRFHKKLERFSADEPILASTWNLHMYTFVIHLYIYIFVKRSGRDYLISIATEVFVITDGIVIDPSGWPKPHVCTLLPTGHAHLPFHFSLYKHRFEKWSLNELTNKPWPFLLDLSARQFVCSGQSTSNQQRWQYFLTELNDVS